jgi:hypothetical protein
MNQNHSQSIKDELSRHVTLINPHWHEYIADRFWWPMRERALGVPAGLTSVANEVVVLVMVREAGSIVARGLRRPARRRGRGRRRRIRVNCLSVGRTYVRTLVTASSSPSSRRERWGWRRLGLQRGESGEGEQGNWRRRWGERRRCGSV